MSNISASLSLDIQTMALNGADTITVRDRVSGEASMLPIAPGDDIASVKKQLQEKIGASPEHLEVFLQGKKHKLGNDVRLDTLDAQNGLEFLYTLAGGSKKKKAAGAADCAATMCEIFAAFGGE